MLGGTHLIQIILASYLFFPFELIFIAGNTKSFILQIISLICAINMEG